MTPLVCTKWYDLGLELFHTEDEKEVDIIETNNKIEGVQTCCRKMFDKWLEYDNVSWDQLVQAMRKIGLNHTATIIENLFTCKAITYVIALCRIPYSGYTVQGAISAK